MKTKGGIDIRQFEKLSEDEAFQQSCNDFKSRVKGDDDAREYADLLNLNEYRDTTKHTEFIKKVNSAIDFISNRKLNRALRKAKRADGVTLVYENEKCFIVTPDGPANSHRAAYLDNATANWCIAVKDKEKAKRYWELYDANSVFYVFLKDGTESWALVVDRYHALRLKASKGMHYDGRFPSYIENRENKIGVGVKREHEYLHLLVKCDLNDGLMRKLAFDHIDNGNFTSIKSVSVAIAALSDKSFHKLAKHYDFNKLKKQQRTGLLESAIEWDAVGKLRYLIETVGIEFKTLYGGDIKWKKLASQEECYTPPFECSGNHLLFEALSKPRCFNYLLELGLNPNVRRERYGMVSRASHVQQKVSSDSLLYCALAANRFKAAKLIVEKGVPFKDDMARFSREERVAFDDDGIQHLCFLLDHHFNPEWTAFVDLTTSLFSRHPVMHKISGVLSLLLDRGVRYDSSKSTKTEIFDGNINAETLNPETTEEITKVVVSLLEMGVPRKLFPEMLL